MKELFIAGLYWLANILILVWSATLAISIWDKKKRLTKAIGLCVIGILWHVARAIYSYSHDLCSDVAGNENLLILANKCIPPLEIDVIYAQAAIFVGLFVVIGEIFTRTRKSHKQIN